MDTMEKQTTHDPRARVEDKTITTLLDSIFDHAAALRDLGQEPPITMPGFVAQYAQDPKISSGS